jgi:AraC-like DNA-binding protein
LNIHPTSSISKKWSVASLWVSNLLDTAQSLGIDRAQLLPEIDMTDAQLRDRNTHIPLQLWHQLAHEIQKISGERNIGIHYVQQNTAVATGLLGMAAMTAPTLQHSWDTVIRYRHIALNLGNTRFVENNDSVVMRWYPYSRAITDSKYLVDAIASGWVINSRRLTGKNITPLNVSLTHPVAEDSELFRSTYGDNVSLNQHYNSIEFRKEDWNLPIRYADKAVHHLLTTQAEKEASIFKSNLTVAETVEYHIKQQLPLGGATVQSIANKINVSPRTLQRQLTKEGTHFKDLLDNARHELALDYLQEGTLSTLDIALKLGYNQSSSFCTAFKGWTGISPSMYFDSQ